MTKYEYIFMDGREEECEADYYVKEYNPRSDTYEYIFYKNGEKVKIVPMLWLDPIKGNPKEV